jgi:hypothetical protein
LEHTVSQICSIKLLTFHLAFEVLMPDLKKHRILIKRNRQKNRKKKKTTMKFFFSPCS